MSNMTKNSQSSMESTIAPAAWRGDIGALAGLPVMEGKAAILAHFVGVSADPVLIDSYDPEEIINITAKIASQYGAIQLEDIAAPACFEIEDRLEELLDIPVFHDDQWGTAVITLAGVINYCQLCERDIGELKVTINGAGAAGIRIADDRHSERRLGGPAALLRRSVDRSQDGGFTGCGP